MQGIEYIFKNPQGYCCGKYNQYPFFGYRKLAQFLQFFFDISLTLYAVFYFVGIEPFDQYPIQHHKQNNGEGHKDEHPIGKTNGVVELFLDIIDISYIGRCANNGTESKIGGVGNTEHEYQREIADTACFVIVCSYNGDDGHGYGKHHHGGGGVTEPEAKETCSENKAEDNAVAIGTCNVDNAQGNTLVQVPFLDSDAYKKASHKEEDDGIGVGFGDLFETGDTRQRKENNGK